VNDPIGGAKVEMLPTLGGERVRLRPGTNADVAVLHEILTQPSVAQWWGEPESHEEITTDLNGDADTYLLVIESDGSVVGGIQYGEENEADYRHASVDIFLGDGSQGGGIGREAIALLARFLFDVRGHHRLVIDPSATNGRAIRCYEAVGFRTVGVMRQYERSPEGTFRDGLLMDLLADELEVGPSSGQELQESIEQPTR